MSRYLRDTIANYHIIVWTSFERLSSDCAQGREQAITQFRSIWLVLATLSLYCIVLKLYIDVYLPDRCL